MKEPTSSTHRSLRSIRVLVALVLFAALVVSFLVLVGRPKEAAANTTNTDVNAGCFIAGLETIAVVIPTTVTDSVDTVAAGSQMTVSYGTSYPSLVDDANVIEDVETVFQMPPQVASIDQVTFTGGGTFTIDTPVIDNVNKKVTVGFHDGGSLRPPTPTTNILVTIDAGASGTINWPVWVETNSVASNIPIFGTITSDCTPDTPGQTLNTTTITGGPTTTTSTTTTTPGPQTCTQTASADGWVKSIWLVGPGGLSQSDGVGTKMYTTDDGLNRFRSSVKFPVVGGACAEGGTLASGVTVTDATLRVTKTKNCICNGPIQRVHKITQSWSENNLLATGGPSVNGTASAEFSTPGLNNAADVQSAQITADVQSFVTTPANNQGWSLRQRYNGSGDTGNNADPAGFATREDSNANYRPKLIITYTP